MRAIIARMVMCHASHTGGCSYKRRVHPRRKAWRSERRLMAVQSRSSRGSRRQVTETSVVQMTSGRSRPHTCPSALQAGRRWTTLCCPSLRRPVRQLRSGCRRSIQAVVRQLVVTTPTFGSLANHETTAGIRYPPFAGVGSARFAQVGYPCPRRPLFWELNRRSRPGAELQELRLDELELTYVLVRRPSRAAIRNHCFRGRR
jgi:hypothetical protein